MVGSIHIEELIQSSCYIITGRVISLLVASRVPIAQVEVLRLIKGCPTDEIYYLAERTWACDITEAVVGEEALLFLKDYRFCRGHGPSGQVSVGRPRTHLDFEEPPGFEESVKVLTKGSRLQEVMHYGRGRMPVRGVGDHDYLTLWVSDVIIPEAMDTVAGPEPQYDFIRSVGFEEMVRYIEEVLRLESEGGNCL